MARKTAADEAPTAPAIRGDAEKPKLSGTVTIACKIPQGLRLQLQHKMKQPVPTGRDSGADHYAMVERWVFGGPVFYVFGPSMPAMGGRPDNYILPERLEGGYALTRGIPAAFWAEWLEQNEKADYVTNKMIFAHADSSVVAKAREHGKLESGLQPLGREVDAQGRLTDRRVPKPLTGSLGRISFDAERTAQQSGAVSEAE